MSAATTRVRACTGRRRRRQSKSIYSAFSAEQIVKNIPFHFSEKKKIRRTGVGRAPSTRPDTDSPKTFKWWLFTNKRSNVVIDEGFLAGKFCEKLPKKRPKVLKAIKEGHENFETFAWVNGSVGSLSDAAR